MVMFGKNKIALDVAVIGEQVVVFGKAGIGKVMYLRTKIFL